MEVTLHKIKVKDLVEGYVDNDEDGVLGYGGKLDIRPPYQREFIYKDKQREAVIDTLRKGFPLNVMYWAIRKDGGYEIIDGQQRTISICQYVNNDFSYKGMFFHNLQDDQQQQILNYKLTIYHCDGTDTEKLEWFKTINIAGEELSDQELRNAVYHGPWVTSAKKYFSKTNGPAYNVGNKYLNGTAIRQHYLETTIKWISNGNIVEYMAQNQRNSNANELWLYFQKVINWVKTTFPKYRRIMKGVQWGDLYNNYGEKNINVDEFESKIKILIMDDDVGNKRGIYYYLFDNQEKHLNIRVFTEAQRLSVYTKQDGICKICKKKFDFEEMEADHIIPWSQGGKTEIENCQMLCRSCNRHKSDN